MLKAVKASSIPIRHGWFTLSGGMSKFKDSKNVLNGKYAEWDEDETVDENRKLAMDHLKMDGQLVHIKHDFKTEIMLATQISSAENEGYDAVMTADPSIVISQTTADCGNIILYCPDDQFAALVHGSWHTSEKNIVGLTVERLQNMGIKPESIKAAIGPMICGKCYEFGHEAVDKFDSQFIKPLKRGKVLLDLPAVIEHQLKEAGVNQIENVGICTYEDKDFASARREGAESPRMISLAQLDKS